MIYDDYKHINCTCGGVIGNYSNNGYSCDRCFKAYTNKFKFDILFTNDKTGWVFPMIRKVKTCGK